MKYLTKGGFSYLCTDQILEQVWGDRSAVKLHSTVHMEKIVETEYKN